MSRPSFRLDGKVAIITGAARGQGAAEARLFASTGARVVVTDVLDDDGKRTAETIGGDALYLHHDVVDEQEWSEVVATTMERFGRVDVLVNNAGIWRTALLEHETLENFEQILRVNLIGTFHGMRAVLPAMRATGGGSIVNVSSTAAFSGIIGHTAYGAAKWAVRGITKTAALELAADRIRVNSIHPGPIDTPMIAGSSAAVNAVATKVAMRRMGAADEVASVALFLASDASSYVTGAEHVVDGGLSAGVPDNPEVKGGSIS